MSIWHNTSPDHLVQYEMDMRGCLLFRLIEEQLEGKIDKLSPMVRQFKFCLVCKKTGYNLNGAELKGYLPPNLLRLHQAI